MSFDKKNLSALLNDLYGPKKAGAKDRDTSAKVVVDTDLSRLAYILEPDKADSYASFRREFG